MKPTLWLTTLLMVVGVASSCDSEPTVEYRTDIKYIYVPPSECPDLIVTPPPDDVIVEPDEEVYIPIEDVKEEVEVPVEVPKLTIKIVLDGEVLTGIAQIQASITGGGAIMGVEFYVDGVPIHTDFIPPYNAAVNTTGFPDGPHFVTVFTADTGGQTANASTSVVFDNTPPQILETIPSEGAALFYEDGPMHMALTVDDPTAIQSAVFRANGLLVQEFVAPPFSTQVDYSTLFIDLSVLPKNIYLQFEVTDYLGQKSEKSINVMVYQRLSWMYTTVGEIWGSAGVMSNGNLVFGNSDYKVICLGPSGNHIWTYAVDNQVIEAPAVDQGTNRVFVGTVSGTVYGLNSNGGQIWTKDLQTPVGGDIVFHNNTVYAPGFNGGLWALDPDNGNTKWEANLPSNILGSPAVSSDNTVYIGCQDNNLYAVKDGSVQWSIPTGNEVWSTPAIALDQTLYFGSNDGWLYAIKADGTTKWVEEVGGQIWGRPWISDDGFVYVASTGKYVTKYESNFGGKIWETKTEGISNSSPVQGADGMVYIGTTGGKIFALEPEGGEIKWTYQVGNTIHATPVARDGMLYFGSTDRNFYGLWTKKPE
jgi:outer membrane protein assembly factor BamB